MTHWTWKGMGYDQKTLTDGRLGKIRKNEQMKEMEEDATGSQETWNFHPHCLGIK